MAQSKNCPFGVKTTIDFIWIPSAYRQYWHLAEYVLTKKCAGIVGCSCHIYIFELNYSINPKWQFLDCATTAFSERYKLFSLVSLPLISKSHIYHEALSRGKIRSERHVRLWKEIQLLCMHYQMYILVARVLLSNLNPFSRKIPKRIAREISTVLHPLFTVSTTVCKFPHKAARCSMKRSVESQLFLVYKPNWQHSNANGKKVFSITDCFYFSTEI